MQGGISKRIGLFLLFFGIPFLFLYIFANGKTNIKHLKYFGKEITDKGKYQVKDYHFQDLFKSPVNKSTLKGKTIIASVIVPSCPSSCPILHQQVEKFIYNKIVKDKNLKNFMLLSVVVDTSGKQVNLASLINEHKVNQSRWKYVTGDKNLLFDFELPKANLKNDKSKDFKYPSTVSRMLMLIDRNNYVRGIYQGDKTMDIDRLSKELRVLEREYAKQDKQS